MAKPKKSKPRKQTAKPKKQTAKKPAAPAVKKLNGNGKAEPVRWGGAAPSAAATIERERSKVPAGGKTLAHGPGNAANGGSKKAATVTPIRPIRPVSSGFGGAVEPFIRVTCSVAKRILDGKMTAEDKATLRSATERSLDKARQRGVA